MLGLEERPLYGKASIHARLLHLLWTTDLHSFRPAEAIASNNSDSMAKNSITHKTKLVEP